MDGFQNYESISHALNISYCNIVHGNGTQVHPKYIQFFLNISMKGFGIICNDTLPITLDPTLGPSVTGYGVVLAVPRNTMEALPSYGADSSQPMISLPP